MTPTSTTARVSDRAGGQFYGTQWQAALDNRADWIAITSWKEYLEDESTCPSMCTLNCSTCNELGFCQYSARPSSTE
jgi:hypothetical protein